MAIGSGVGEEPCGEGLRDDVHEQREEERGPRPVATGNLSVSMSVSAPPSC